MVYSQGMSDELLRALIDTDTKRTAYLTNAEFHAVVDTLVLTLPDMIAASAELAAAQNHQHRLEVDRLMGRNR